MTLLDTGMVGCGTCKFIRVEMQDLDTRAPGIC